MSIDDRTHDSQSPKRLDMAEVSKGLASRKDNPYWRSMEELANTEQFQQFIDDEFPNRSSILDLDRRDFMKFMGASMLLAGIGTVGGCRWLPQEKIIPYVKAPEDFIPGKALYFASASTFCGYATGVLVESHMGRPTKVDGNPDHPASLGGLDAIQQASILTMYDPDRAQDVMNGSDSSTIELFLAAIRKVLDASKKTGGPGFRILTDTITSPTLEAQMAELLAAFPGAKWHQWEPVGRDNVKAGAQMAFGKYVDTIYRFDQASVVFSIDADFLLGMPGSVRYARDFSSTRAIEGQSPKLSRLYVAESSPTLAGANADHRLPLKSSQIPVLAQVVAGKLGAGPGGGLPQGVSEKWVDALVSDLKQAGSKALVVAGDFQPPEVHALAHAMNQVLGSVGTTVQHIEPVEAAPMIQLDSIKELVADMQAGKVTTLLVIGDMNPAYSAPSDLKFVEAMSKVKLKALLSTFADDTSALCDWHIPMAHWLEAWSDGRAYDGTVSIVQPLIAPLYKGISAHELISHLLGRPRPGYDTVREFWKAKGPSGAEFESSWREALNSGIVANTQSPTVTVSAGAPPAVPAASGTGMEIIFRPDPTIWDGRLANNGWLQELPKPISQMTWDNSAQMSPATAAKLNVQDDDFIYLTHKNQKVKAQVLIIPGHPDEAITAHLGYGRKVCGQVGLNPGYSTSFDAYQLRTSQGMWADSGLEAEAAHERPDGLAKTQMYFSMEGRDIVRVGTVEEYAKNPSFRPPHSHSGELESMYPENPTPWPEQPDHYQWALTIDLNQCIGCNACVTACQAENNIPIVGKPQVLRGRVMHWLRVDRYYRVKEGAKVEDAELGNTNDLDSKNIETVFMPVACMHCEKAPCEPVCPVAATVHSHEGLNQMVYNRCVGTRYCSNNCPYKVRRFNYLNYGDKTNGNLLLNYRLNLVNNPNVTVRGRGVMEKCTYCVQRINEARIEAKKSDIPIKDGEIVTACQQACPTRAITFGNISDEKSAVSKTRKDGRNYSLLEELGTIPRTTYLSKLRNPNPELERA